jgi:Protein of unknown function (DUF2889)
MTDARESPSENCLRRLIDLQRWDEHTVVGWVEDDFHHFGVTIEHADGHVRAVRVATVRYPWATCLEVGAPLQALVGCEVPRRASDIGAMVDMRAQCTHVFDLSGLVLAHITRADRHRRYEVLVSDPDILRWNGEYRPVFGPLRAELFQNDERVMYWEIADNAITTPGEYAGQSLGGGFRAWTESMDEASAEHATILRRAILVAGGRAIDHDRIASAAAMHQPALCHSFQPERREMAVRMVRQKRDYAASGHGMLSELRRKP